MSKKISIVAVQPDPQGPVFGRVMDPNDFMKGQDYEHAHTEKITKDLLVAGAAGAQVAGFAAALTNGLNVSIAKGDVVDVNGMCYETESDVSTVVAVAAAHQTLPRIDLIYATLDIDAAVLTEFRPFRRLRTQAELEAGLDPYPPTQYEVPTELHTRAVVNMRSGVANANPVAPVAGAGEVALWTVHVAAGQINLGNGDLTSVRVLMKSLYQSQTDITALQAALSQSGLSEVVQDIVGAMLQQGSGITLVYNDAGNVESIAVDSEAIQDIVGALLQQSTGIVVTYNDAGNVESIAVDTSYLDGRYINQQGDDISFGNTDGSKLKLTGNLADNSGITAQRVLHLAGNLDVGNSGVALLYFEDTKDYGMTPIGYMILAHGSTGTGVGHTAFSVKTSGDGVFGRNLSVVGTLSKGAGTFHIDHPLDPENKDLVHGFIESPRYDLIYRGTAKLKKGTAVVSIDEASGMSEGTFAALTRNAQGHAWNESKDEDNFDLVRLVVIVDGKAFISSNNKSSSAEVGWCVIAERNDRYIHHCETTDSDGRLLVEREKPAGDPSFLEPTTEVRNERQAQPTRVSKRIVDELLGTKGYPRHAHLIGEGAAPTRTVTIETRDREGNPYQEPNADSPQE